MGNHELAATLTEAEENILGLIKRLDSMKMFAEKGNAQAVGFTDTELRHLRWALSRGLCSVKSAAEVFGVDPSALQSAVGFRR